ncbi:uncharacterized protein JN550_002585 [Neoarthrinium moseri]|uniref:uncharacterized protein n=1 Tax=Neoarthrinium moseri TaxID=1658444 RepID=UPI001FDC9BD5|nr:uncharacterized protein JN550_002585 [Neoarthrinium moseri]KAI1874006.1 hypothetical protein JN550_002585 [Neoarthrinium moseri]
MEALVAVGVASNAVQFVDFASKLLHTFHELRHNAASAENQDHAVIVAHLRDLTGKISDEAKALEQGTATVNADDKALQPVAEGCCVLARQLLQRLETCGVHPGRQATFLKRSKTALKCMWNKREIQEITERLHHFRSEIQFHLMSRASARQISPIALQSIDDQLKKAARQLEELSMENKGLETQIQNTISLINGNHAALSHQITQWQPQEKSQSQNSVGFGLEGDRRFAGSFQPVSTPESILSPFEDTFGAGFREIQGSIIEAVRDELKANSLAELACVETFFRHATQQMEIRLGDALKSSRENTELSSGLQVEKTVSMKEPTTPEMNSKGDDTETVRRYQHQTIRTDVSLNIYTVLCRRRWSIDVGLGEFYLKYEHLVEFISSGPARDIFEINAHWIPSPAYFSTGITGDFRYLTHPCAPPKLIFQPRIYRVLPSYHEAWEVIQRGDLISVRRMLTEKTMLPSDQNAFGEGLLHFAAFHGEVDICKALISCGADVDARCRQGCEL